MSKQLSIEARSLVLNNTGKAFSHNFLVLREAGTTGQNGVIATLHGMAMKRKSGEIMPIGYPWRDTLRGVHNVYTKEFANELPADLKAIDVKGEKKYNDTGRTLSYKGVGSGSDIGTYIMNGQQYETLYTGNANELKQRWFKAVHASQELSKLNRNYPLFGAGTNSNSAFATYSEIMGLKVVNFPGIGEPGLKKRVFSRDQIDKLKFKPQADKTTTRSETKTEPEQDNNSASSLKPSLKNPYLPKQAWKALGFEVKGEGIRISGKGSDGAKKEYTAYSPGSVTATDSAKTADPYKAGREYLLENGKKQQRLEQSKSPEPEVGI